MAGQPPYIVTKEIKTLKPAEYNPRQIDKDAFSQLKRSLESFDCVEPVVINTNPDRFNVIIGGHQRIKAAKDLKWEEFPCIEVDLPIEKEKELNVRLNKNTGDFDFDMLANHFEVEDLVDWGFDEKDFFYSTEESEVDLSEELSESNKVEISCVDEIEAESLFKELSARGLKCKILSI